jgi:hypothetical protein
MLFIPCPLPHKQNNNLEYFGVLPLPAEKKHVPMLLSTQPISISHLLSFFN